MDLELDTEQTALRDSARGFLDRHAPASSRGALSVAATGDLWRGVGQLGWLELGAGDEDDLFGVVGSVIVSAEIGAHAVPLPFAEHTVFASRVLTMAGDAGQRHTWGRGLAGGAPVCTAAVVEEHCDWSLVGLQARARPSAGGWRVTGRKTSVPFAARAGAIAVVADTGDGLGLFVVERGADGLRLEPEEGFDASREPSAILLDDVEVRSDAAIIGPHVDAALAMALRTAAVSTAAEGYGAAGALLDIAVAYAKERTQFGRPIASFQAIAHLLADMLVLKETSWSTVLHAAAAIDARLADADAGALVAASHAGRASRSIAEGALQVLGGIGFSDEHEAHPLLARVLECEQRFGDPLTHERALVERLLPTPREVVV